MTYLKITALSSIEAPDHKSLLHAWRMYGPGMTVARYTVQKPLTTAQLRRLPADLRARLK
jgi:hypothetical protein